MASRDDSDVELISDSESSEYDPTEETDLLSNDHLSKRFDLEKIIRDEEVCLYKDRDITEKELKFLLHFIREKEIRVVKIASCRPFDLSNLHRQIVELILPGNGLTEIGRLDLPHLKRLTLSSNRLTVFPDVSGMPNLIQLNVGSNRIRDIPVFHHSRLLSLDLHFNHLTEIPDLHLPTLRKLNGFHNQIRKISNFSFLKRLKYLNLRSNVLTEIPDFTHLKLLNELNLERNLFTKTPRFTNLPHLACFSILGNPLVELPRLGAPVTSFQK